MTVAKLTEGLNLIEAGVAVFENTDSDEESLAKTKKKLRKLTLLLQRDSKR